MQRGPLGAWKSDEWNPVPVCSNFPVRVEGNIRRNRGHGINHRESFRCFTSCTLPLLPLPLPSAIAMAPSDTTTDVRRKGPRIEEAISNPGAVKINVKGAFIVDDEPRSRSPVEAEGVHYETKDIRLPHHTGVVSHVAVDVSCLHPWSAFLFFSFFFFFARRC